LQRPVAPADEKRCQDQNRAAGDGQLVSGERDSAAGFLRGLAFGREQVDADHRSPAFRSARPTATAAVGMTLSGSVIPSFAGSNVTLWKGLNASTGAPNRLSSACAKPSTREAPPLSSTRSMRSDAAVALKKSNVFWI